MSQQEETTVTVELPDGSTLDVPSGTTVEGVAYEIGPGLGDDTVAGLLDGDLVAKEAPVYDGAEVEVVTPSADEYVAVLRHSAAHVFAQALQRLYPDAKLTIGPWTDEGFYYDVTGVDLDEDDLEAIDDEAHEIIEADLDIEQVQRDREAAFELYEDNEYKREILETEAAGSDPVSFYEQGEFRDLCQGPHVDSTGEIGGFALLEISASYWRGDENNDTLTRVYGTAFPTEDDLAEFLEQRRKARERDHRRIGREMDLFSIDETAGPGLPLYEPNGKTVLNELSAYVASLNRDAGYDEVETPHVFRTELWKKSGHYENYVDDMFLLEVNDEEYGLKPMNCPGHATIFDQRSWSYRDLPVRYFEDGKVYRREQRGELSGLSRTWAFTIDDGHLFVRPDQIEDEVLAIMGIILDILGTFDLDYTVQLATRPEKSVGSDEIWTKAQSQLEAVLENEAIDYVVEDGDGAFYGPKVDFAFEDALGRDWDGPTVQLDFNMPERFDLTYTGEDNEDHRPVMIHRALYGSYERFFMVLVEHFDGRFPLWLAPEQVRVLPLSEDVFGYARDVAETLDDDGFRVSVATGDDTLQRKIRAGHDDNLPYMLIVGPDERDAETVSVRDRKERTGNDVDTDAFRTHLRAERDERRLEPDFLD
jgi:threonyl-tRNA synthetase